MSNQKLVNSRSINNTSSKYDTLDKLRDCYIGNPSDNEQLIFDSSKHSWTNKKGQIANLDDVNIQVNSLSNGEILSWTDGKWGNISQIPISNIPDIPQSKITNFLVP